MGTTRRLTLVTALAFALVVAGLLGSCGGGGGSGGAGGGGVGGGNPIPPAPSNEVWQEAGVAVNNGPTGIIMPEAVLATAGLYRMYFGQARGDGGWDIWYAESPDASQWIVKGIALAGIPTPLENPEFSVTGASLVRLSSGWRMYYQASQYSVGAPPNPNPPPYFQTMSAFSSDGVNFTREGVRIGNRHYDPTALLSVAAHTRVIQLQDGTDAAYVSGTLPMSGPTGLILCLSSDGLTFSSPQLLLENAHDPYVVLFNGSYLLYVDPTSSAVNTFSYEALMSSPDGLNWSAPASATFQDASGNMLTSVGDFGGIVMPDGTLRLFSEYNSPTSLNLIYYRRISP